MKQDIIISSDKDRLDMPFIHGYLSERSYWAKGRSMEEVVRSIENSICFGAYAPDGRQVAFARVLSDGVVFSWLMDVFVVEEERGNGVGKMLVEHILGHELVLGSNGIGLRTKDAHKMYRRYGFGAIPEADGWMYRDNRSRKHRH